MEIYLFNCHVSGKYYNSRPWMRTKTERARWFLFGGWFPVLCHPSIRIYPRLTLKRRVPFAPEMLIYVARPPLCFSKTPRTSTNTTPPSSSVSRRDLRMCSEQPQPATDATVERNETRFINSETKIHEHKTATEYVLNGSRRDLPFVSLKCWVGGAGEFESSDNDMWSAPSLIKFCNDLATT